MPLKCLEMHHLHLLIHAQESKKVYFPNNHAKIYVVEISCKITTFLKLSPSSEYLRKIYQLADFIVVFAYFEQSCQKQKD